MVPLKLPGLPLPLLNRPLLMKSLQHLSLLSLRFHGIAHTDALFTTPVWLREHGLAIPPTADLNLQVVSASGAASEAFYQIQTNLY